MSFYLSDLYTLLLLLFFVFISMVTWIDNKRLLLLIQSPFNQKYYLKYPRFESNNLNFLTVINILIIQSVLISFYVFQISETMSIFLFSKIISLMAMWWVLRFLILWGISKVFDLEHEANKYFHGYFNNLFLLSVVFFPIIIITSYSFNGHLFNISSIYCYCLFALCYLIMKIIQLKRLNLFKVRLIFYNILYLYILEILPYLILFKLLQVI